MGTVLSTASDGTELGQLTQTGQRDIVSYGTIRVEGAGWGRVGCAAGEWARVGRQQ